MPKKKTSKKATPTRNARVSSVKKKSVKKASPKRGGAPRATAKQGGTVSKKSSTLSKAPKKRSKPTIRGIETSIRQLDDSLITVINQRAELVGQIGELRRANGKSPVSFERESDAVSDVAWKGKGPVTDRHLQSIFRDIESACRSTVRRIRVAFLGPLYSYSHLAAIRRFGNEVEMSPVGNIASVFEEVQRGTSEFGIVPIENSTDGRIADTLEMFSRMPIRICGQIELPIHHTLLGVGDRDQIREVYSKPQALSQCRNWIAKHLPAAKTVEVASTTVAAQIARNMNTAAAIASREAGLKYGLNILAEQIEDNPNNITRFAVIGDHASERTGNDRTALFFQTEHRFGALADALTIFKRNSINMSWIESFPLPGTDRTYLFFAELEGHEMDPDMRRALDVLRRKSLRLEVLGSFPATEPE